MNTANLSIIASATAVTLSPIIAGLITLASARLSYKHEAERRVYEEVYKRKRAAFFSFMETAGSLKIGTRDIFQDFREKTFCLYACCGPDCRKALDVLIECFEDTWLDLIQGNEPMDCEGIFAEASRKMLEPLHDAGIDIDEDRNAWLLDHYYVIRQIAERFERELEPIHFRMRGRKIRERIESKSKITEPAIKESRTQGLGSSGKGSRK